MNLRPSPLAFIVFLLAGWIGCQQVIVIEYLKAEKWMLRERVKSARCAARINSVVAGAQGLRHSAKGLLELGTIVTPDTLLLWPRQLIARKPT